MAYIKTWEPVKDEFSHEEEFKIPRIPLDLPQILAEKQARKLFGRSIVVDSKHPKVIKYLNEFIRLNRLNEQIVTFEENNSKFGQSISFLEPIAPGEKVPRWGYADPYMISRVEKMYVTETSATIYKYIVKDSKTWPVVETWTRDTVKRLYYTNLSEADTGQGVFYRLEELAKRDIHSVEEVKHNLGCMPIDEVRNKQGYVSPMIDIWNWKTTLATWYPVKGLIKIAYEMIIQTVKRMILSKPKIVGELTPDQMEAIRKGDWGPYTSDWIISLRTVGDDKGGPSPLQVVQSPLDLVNDIDAFKALLDLIFIGSGFSPINDNAILKTATEVVANQEITSEALRLLKQLRIDQLTRIFSKAVIIGISAGELDHDWDGMGEPPFILSFPPEENMNKEEVINTAMFLINNNLSDHVTELAKLNSISKEEAETRLNEILANNKKVFESITWQVEGDTENSSKGDGGATSLSRNISRKTTKPSGFGSKK